MLLWVILTLLCITSVYSLLSFLMIPFLVCPLRALLLGLRIAMDRLLALVNLNLFLLVRLVRVIVISLTVIIIRHIFNYWLRVIVLVVLLSLI